MTNELEKQFFDTFGIEPKYKDYRTKNGKIYDNKNPENRNIRLCYPQITDRILLELIKLLIIDEGVNISGFNIVDLDGRQYKEFGITCLDYFYDEPECDEEDYEPIQSTGTLKECVLKALILINEKYNDFFKHQVRTLFEEG